MELYFTALMMGLLGGGHCLAMCGSLSMALGFSIPSNKSFLMYSGMISLGRILGYGIVGFTANALTQTVITITDGGIIYLSILSSILMIGIGLHIANLNNLVLKTEILGKFITPLIEPVKQRILPIDSFAKCLSYGFFWGFLPCGLVYTAITLALVASSPIQGFGVMLSFGIGTLPLLLGMTAFNSKLNSILSNNSVRLGLGFIVIIMAVNHMYKAVAKLQVL